MLLNTPILLFPLKIETRFIENHLWIRVFPDAALQYSHNPKISKDEKVKIETYIQTVDKAVAWQNLVSKYGVYRSACLVRISELVVSNGIGNIDEERLKTYLEKGGEEVPTVCYKYLPKKFVAHLYPKEEDAFTVEFDNDTPECLIALGDEDQDDWLYDFGKAIEKGMAIKIETDNNSFDRIIVTGIYNDDGNNTKVSDLFSNHLYTSGASFLEYGSPTNNLEYEETSYSIRDEFDALSSYESLVKGKELEIVEGNALKNVKGGLLSKGLAVSHLSKNPFKYYLNNNEEKPENRLRSLLQKLTWFALGGDSLRILLGEGSKEKDKQIWKHFYNYVHPRGPLPAIRIGDQPYGILPVTKVTGGLNLEIETLFNRWKKMIEQSDINNSRLPRMGGEHNTNQELTVLHHILSMQPSSTSMQVRAMGYAKSMSIDSEESSVKEIRKEKIKGLLNNDGSNIINGFKNKEEKILQTEKETGLFIPLVPNDLGYLKNVFSNLNDDEKGKLEDKLPSTKEELEEQISEDQKEAITENLKFHILEQDPFIVQYLGETSIISDLLLRSYANTIDLYTGKDRISIAQNVLVEINELIDLISLDAIDKETLRATLYEVMDLSSYRLDAWITSFATKRLEEIRANNKEQILFGAYGWVENLEKDANSLVDSNMTDTNNIGEGGYIHTPSAPQSMVATLFKNSYLSYKNGDAPNPFTLNLTSDRIQQSEQFMQGIREGQSIEALLGYKLERLLHEHGIHEHGKNLDSHIYELRKKYPLKVNTINANGEGFTNLSVIDGLKVIRANSEGKITNSEVSNCIEKLVDTLDGSLDHLLYEAGFHLMQGRLSQSSAAMDAAKGDIDPPKTNSLKTKIPGVGMKHQLVYLFPKSTAPALLNGGVYNIKAHCEPVLETWLDKHLENKAEIFINVGVKSKDKEWLKEEDYKSLGLKTSKVKINEEEEISVLKFKFEELNLSYLDLFYLSENEISDNATELELRIWKKIKELLKEKGVNDEYSYQVIDNPESVESTIFEVLEVCRYAWQLLVRRSEWRWDELSSDEEKALIEELGEIKDRIDKIKERLSTWADNSNYEALSKLNISEAKRIYLTANNEDGDEKLKSEVSDIEKKVKQHLENYKNIKSNSEPSLLFDELNQAAKILFGKSFILLRPIILPKKIKNNLPNQKALIGNLEKGQERIQAWVEELAQVDKDFEIFEEWQMVSRVGNGGVIPTYKIAQPLTGKSYPWAALSKKEIDLLIQTEYTNPTYKDLSTEESYPTTDGDYYPHGCESYVFYSDDEISKNQIHYGFVIGEISEHIPDEKMSTALSFHYNGPNNEAPQALLLAVSPKDEDRDWTTGDLSDIINDTMDLMKIRLLDLEAIEDLGFALPMTNLFNIPVIN